MVWTSNRSAELLPPGLAADRPEAPGTGRYFYFATDDGSLSLWDGSAWNEVGGGGGGALPITTQGDLVIGDAMGAAARLAKGADGMVLRAGATTVAWDWPLPEATAASQLLASTGAGRAYAALTSSALRALVSSVFRRPLELKLSQGWALTQPSAGATSFVTGPDAIEVSIPTGTTFTGGAADVSGVLVDDDPYLTFSARLGAPTHNSSSGELYVLQMGAPPDLLIGIVRGDGSAALAYYVGGSFVTVGTGTAPASWVSALASGQAVMSLVRTPLSVGLSVGVGATISTASRRTIIVSDNVVAVRAPEGDALHVGLDVDAGSRPLGTVVRFFEARTIAQGGGAP